MSWERVRGVKDDAKVFDLTAWKNTSTTSGDEEGYRKGRLCEGPLGRFQHTLVEVLGRQLTPAQGWSSGRVRDTNVGVNSVRKVWKPWAGGGHIVGGQLEERIASGAPPPRRLGL